MCVRACARVCVCVCVCACMRACVRVLFVDLFCFGVILNPAIHVVDLPGESSLQRLAAAIAAAAAAVTESQTLNGHLQNGFSFQWWRSRVRRLIVTSWCMYLGCLCCLESDDKCHWVGDCGWVSFCTQSESFLYLRLLSPSSITVSLTLFLCRSVGRSVGRSVCVSVRARAFECMWLC